MIIFRDIRVGDIVKIQVVYDEIEEDLYARVDDVRATTLDVKYYVATSKIYRGACLYGLDSEVESVLQESLTEHYINGTSPFESKEEMVYIPEEVMSEYSDSEVEDMSESESDDEDGFVVPDDASEAWEPPLGSQAIDDQWDSWAPPTAGARNFKSVVDRIEQCARLQVDELRF